MPAIFTTLWTIFLVCTLFTLPAVVPEDSKSKDKGEPVIFGFTVNRGLVEELEEDDFNVVGENLNTITDAWITKNEHCFEEDEKKMTLRLGKSERYGRTRDFLMKRRPISDEYLFCARNGSFTAVKNPSLEGWRPLIKLKVTERSESTYLPWYIQIPLIVFLALLSALFSGLNVGLMSLSVNSLECIKRYDPVNREHAEKILPLRENGNLLLCALLLGNSVTNNAMTLLTANMFSTLHLQPVVHIVLSVLVPSVIIMFIGEIVPQAICCRQGLVVGSRTRWITIYIIALTLPISYPLSKLLDWTVGKEGPEQLDLPTLKLMIEMNVEPNQGGRQPNNGGLTRVEADLFARFLDVNKPLTQVMTSSNQIFMLPEDTIVDCEFLKQMNQRGYMRIPIYRSDNRNFVMGIVNLKDLTLIDGRMKLRIGTIVQLWRRSRSFRVVTEDYPVLQLFKDLKVGMPLSLVIRHVPNRRDYEIVGLVALEDIIEEITGDIMDEKDRTHQKRLERSLFGQ